MDGCDHVPAPAEDEERRDGRVEELAQPARITLDQRRRNEDDRDEPEPRTALGEQRETQDRPEEPADRARHRRRTSRPYEEKAGCYQERQQHVAAADARLPDHDRHRREHEARERGGTEADCRRCSRDGDPDRCRSGEGRRHSQAPFIDAAAHLRYRGRGPVEKRRLWRKVFAIELREKPISGLSHFPDDTRIEGLIVTDKISNSNSGKIQHQGEEAERRRQQEPGAKTGRAHHRSLPLGATWFDRPFHRTGSPHHRSCPMSFPLVSRALP